MCVLTLSVDMHVYSAYLGSNSAMGQNMEGNLLFNPATTSSEVCPKKVNGKRPDTRMLIITLFIMITNSIHQ